MICCINFLLPLAEAVSQWGYPGIFLLMALESSFFPFPGEVVIPPAAYLAAAGEMNIALVILCGTTGSLVGAMFNYWLAFKFGRPFLQKYGRYFLVSPKALAKADQFFERHGHISTFIGRLLPGIRQYISLPAGLARMNVAAFVAATVLGASIWVVVLAVMGYWFGKNEQMVLQNLHKITLVTIAGCVIVGILYWWRWRNRLLKNELRDN